MSAYIELRQCAQDFISAMPKAESEHLIDQVGLGDGDSLILLLIVYIDFIQTGDLVEYEKQLDQVREDNDAVVTSFLKYNKEMLMKYLLPK